MKYTIPLFVAALLLSPLGLKARELVLPMAQINTTQGRVLIDANDAFHVKTIRMPIAAHTDLPPHGPEKGYFIATVISGTLQLGIGDTFDETRLRALPPGSVFTHPLTEKHFARTGDEPVVLQVTLVEPPDAGSDD